MKLCVFKKINNQYLSGRFI